VSCNYDIRRIDVYPILSGFSFFVVGEPKSYGRDDTPPAWVNEMRDPDGYVDWAIIDFGWYKEMAGSHDMGAAGSD